MRQLVVMGIFLLLMGLLVLTLYTIDRQREWVLRQEQATHRLELAWGLITRDLQRVRSDIYYVATQDTVREFQPADEPTRKPVEQEFSRFLAYKNDYEQIRLVDRSGQEVVRVEVQEDRVEVVPQPRLQDKRERYYVRKSLSLKQGEIFVSEFDLNEEYGVIERPLNPVIRFVTPACDESGALSFLLVLNFRGAPLLRDLATISLPGQTLLIRDDGQYLLGPAASDGWGWLLGHQRSFADQFPAAWNNRYSDRGCFLTTGGAFGFRRIDLQQFGGIQDDRDKSATQLLVVSRLPAGEVFGTSNQLLNRLLLLVAIILLPLLVLTRFWAVASERRQRQNQMIQESEQKLRELSSRLVQIQEDERRAISREIHDQLGQQVTAINLDLKLANRAAVPAEVRVQLERAIDESEQLLDTLHDFATRVRPDVLDDLGLHDAVESHLWDFRERTGIEVHLESTIHDANLPMVVAENVYRLIQESLNNVVRHANASRVDVAMQLTEVNGDPALLVSVQDDGTGAVNPADEVGSLRPPGKGQPRLGILGMQERVDLLGGHLDMVSGTNQGTAVRISVPLGDPAGQTNGKKAGTV